MPPRAQPPKMAGARCANQARSVRHGVVDPRRESGHRSAPLLLVRPMAAMQPAIRAAGARPHLVGRLRAGKSRRPLHHRVQRPGAQRPKDHQTPYQPSHSVPHVPSVASTQSNDHMQILPSNKAGPSCSTVRPSRTSPVPPGAAFRGTSLGSSHKRLLCTARAEDRREDDTVAHVRETAHHR